MAEKYIVNMPQKTTPADTDLMIIEDAQDTKRMTWANVVKPIKDTVAAHEADDVTHVGGVHGLEIEEGEWTPFIRGHLVAGNHTYGSQLGSYYRINKLIIVRFGVVLTQLDSNMSGAIQIAGLPFSLATSDMGASFTRVSNVVLATGHTGITGFGNGDSIQLQSFGSDKITNYSTVSLRDTSYIRGSMAYYTK